MMVIGDRVQLKVDDAWVEGEIINLYAIPKDWCLLDVKLDNGDVIRGISSQDVYGV